MEIRIGNPNMTISTENQTKEKKVKYLTQEELDAEFPIENGYRRFLVVSGVETVRGKKVITLPDGRKIKIIGSENIRIEKTDGNVNISL